MLELGLKMLSLCVATVRFGWLSRDFFTAYIPSALGMLVYNDLYNAK